MPFVSTVANLRGEDGEEGWTCREQTTIVSEETCAMLMGRPSIMNPFDGAFRGGGCTADEARVAELA